MKKIYFVLFASIGLTLYSCGTSNLTERNIYSECPSSFYGKFEAHYKIDAKKSILIIEDVFLNAKVIAGQIDSTDKNGVYFKYVPEGKKSIKTDKYFKYTEIKTLIDSNSKLLFGRLPDELKPNWELTIHLLNQTNNNKYEFLIKSFSPFDFCIDSGLYKISGIDFTDNYDSKNSSKISLIDSNIIFNILPNTRHYMGTIYLDTIMDPSSNTLYFKNNRIVQTKEKIESNGININYFSINPNASDILHCLNFKYANQGSEEIKKLIIEKK